MPSKQLTTTFYPSGYDNVNYKYASVNSSYPLSNPVGKASSNTSYTQINLTTGSNAESYVFYTFDCSSIPSGATIDSISCSAKGYVSQTTASRVATRQMQLYYGTSTAKGSAYTLSTSTTAATLTPGTWTRDELNDIRIRLYCKRGTSNTTTNYYMRFYGATLTITYTYEYQLYTITTNVTNGSSNPVSYEMESTDNKTFTFDGNTGREQLTSLTYNGEDILSDAVLKTNLNNNYDVTLTKSGASYGFIKSGDYYESNNKGQGGNILSQGTSAVCTVNFNLSCRCLVNFYVINWAQEGNDYGLLSNINQSFSTNKSADSTRYWVGNTADKNSPNEQLVSYEMNAGTNTIDVKFVKNYGTNSNNDSIKFRIEILPMDYELFSYEYTVVEPNSDGSIIAIFGDPIPIPKEIFIKNGLSWKKYSVAYKKINGVWTEIDTSEAFDVNTKYVKGV